MRQFHQNGHILDDLLLRCDPNNQWAKLIDIFPHPMIPFQSHPERNPQQAPPESKRPAPTKHQEAHAPAHAAQGHGIMQACPTSTSDWEYKDTQGRIQGPFTLQRMWEWHQMGYVLDDLLLRCDRNDQWAKLIDIFPHPMIPFQSYPKRNPSQAPPESKR
jgi:hypothetical protein